MNVDKVKPMAFIVVILCILLSENDYTFQNAIGQIYSIYTYSVNAILAFRPMIFCTHTQRIRDKSCFVSFFSNWFSG